MATEYKRLVMKVSDVTGEVATIPTTNDHSDGSWIDTDIYKGEIFINLVDSVIQTRDDNGIITIKNSVSGSVSTGKNQIPLLIGFGQSNTTITRGSTLPTNDRSYTEQASNLIVVPNTITVTNSNSGGAWNGSTSSLKMLHNRWKSDTNSLGWQVGVDKALDFQSFNKVLFVEASVGGQPVSYFHPGGGSRISNTGAGWIDLENKLTEAYEWAEIYGFELVPFGVFTWQGESDGATSGVNQTSANLWMEDWVEIHEALKTLLNISKIPHNFMQIFHETPATMVLRDRLNLAMENKAIADSEYNYIELMTASDISNEDPNELTQDMEHWGYRGYFKGGIGATDFFINSFDPEVITITPPVVTGYVRPDFSLFSPTAVVEAVGGAISVTHGALTLTQNSNVTFRAGDLNTGGEVTTFPNTAGGYLTNFTPVFATGFSWVIRFRITAYGPSGHVLSGNGNGMYFMTDNLSSDLQMVRLGSDKTNTFGVNVNDNVWRTMGCTLLTNGNVQLFTNGVKVRDAAITSAVLGAMSIFTWGSSPSLGAVGEMAWCLLNNSPLSESEMITLTSE